MSDYSIRVSGAEPDVEAFRKELARELKAAGIPADGVQISTAKPVPVPLTEPAPLGHIEWVEIAVKIVIGVLSPVATELVKKLIDSYTKKHPVNATETTARGTSA